MRLIPCIASFGSGASAMVGCLLISLCTSPCVAEETGGAPVPETVGAPWPDPGEGVLAFDVLRNGKPLGTAVYTFAQDGEDWVVTSDVDLKVKVGFVTAFRYRFDATERWRDGRLVSLESQVLKDGDDLIVSIAQDAADETLSVSGRDYTGTAPGDMLPTSWWHAGVVGQTTMIHTENGALMDFTTTPLGEETVATHTGDVVADCYELAASLTLKACYDADDRWVKMELTARGSDIEYVLVSGQGG